MRRRVQSRDFPPYTPDSDADPPPRGTRPYKITPTRDPGTIRPLRRCGNPSCTHHWMRTRDDPDECECGWRAA